METSEQRPVWAISGDGSEQSESLFTGQYEWPSCKAPGQTQVFPFFLPSRGQKRVLNRQGHPPPLLLLQLMVSDLLALQVQLGVLQLSCQPLALLLKLLQGPLALITVCLQVPDLEAQIGCNTSSH